MATAERRTSAQQEREQQNEILEVKGFDLLSEVEAMLRNARQYQREVQRFRGILGKGQTQTSELPPIDAITEQVRRLRQTIQSMVDVVNDIEHTVTVVAARATAQKPSRRRR
jgi:esterase/lipase